MGTGVKNLNDKKKTHLTTCAKITTHRHGRSNACTYTDASMSASEPQNTTHTHTLRADAADRISLSSSGSVVATPEPHLPLSRLILLVGSIIWLAVWVPVSCFPGDSQAMGAGTHWAEASPASAAAVWETERGVAQMLESGANRRYG